MKKRKLIARFANSLTLICILLVAQLPAANVAVRYKEGLTHGFLVVSTLDGQLIAVGDLLERVRGSEVTSRLTYRFKDGSLQDETTVFSQSRQFRLISDHTVQKGPIFPEQSDVLIEMASGRVTMLVASPKPRIVKLKITSPGKDPFLLATANHEAIHYEIKVDIGGVSGALAPLLGKQPPDSHVWILGGEAPTFVKSVSLSYVGGPLWTTELLAPTWPKSPAPEQKQEKQ